MDVRFVMANATRQLGGNLDSCTLIFKPSHVSSGDMTSTWNGLARETLMSSAHLETLADGLTRAQEGKRTYYARELCEKMRMPIVMIREVMTQ
ncbi:hypothetical protein HZH66_010235 [Vespula vulgaris]|uniref:Uncharacterized protein n=1 Tax=Vespula vulgaris TaxID=7454 RepID=A0A834JI04_VESVU|nr:hypothetical protein HZH66_010235 [Vespula vulgaris]